MWRMFIVEEVVIDLCVPVTPTVWSVVDGSRSPELTHDICSNF